MIVTIDGPAGAGKSTVSKLLAGKLGFFYLDTGALYRALAYAMKKEEVSPTDNEKFGPFLRRVSIELFKRDLRLGVKVKGEDVESMIRTEEIGILASKVSQLPEVREKLLPIQRQAAHMGDIVAEGRDMGTVVFPWAEVKFFLHASLDERVERRMRELIARGEKDVNRDKIITSILTRDRQDMERDLAPLKPHQDAIIIDTSNLSVEEVVEKMVGFVRERQG